MNRSRFFIGLGLVIVAVALMIFTDLNTVSVIAIGVLGLVSIAISRKKK